MRWPSRWPPLVALGCLVVGLVVVAGVGGPLRVAIVLGFLTFCPGMAFVPLLPAHRPAGSVALAIALSLAIDTTVATTMVLAHRFSPDAGLIVLVGLCLVGCGLQIRRWPPEWSAIEVRWHG